MSKRYLQLWFVAINYAPPKERELQYTRASFIIVLIFTLLKMVYLNVGPWVMNIFHYDIFFLNKRKQEKLCKIDLHEIQELIGGCFSSLGIYLKNVMTKPSYHTRCFYCRPPQISRISSMSPRTNLKYKHEFSRQPKTEILRNQLGFSWAHFWGLCFFINNVVRRRTVHDTPYIFKMIHSIKKKKKSF